MEALVAAFVFGIVLWVSPRRIHAAQAQTTQQKERQETVHTRKMPRAKTKSEEDWLFALSVKWGAKVL